MALRHIRVASRHLSNDGVKQLLLAYRARGSNGVIVDDFRFMPGMLYTQVRAISARINQNYDAWPSKELIKSYKTFLGKPVFVNHNNEDPAKARGRVVAARYVDGGRDKYVEVIQEIDAKRFPKLAHEIRSGGLDSVSMGVEAGFTICSVCKNKATDTWDMCSHVRHHKGEKLYSPKTGKRTLVYEDCYKLGFFELSYVFDPADETAVVSRVIAASNRKKAPMKGQTNVARRSRYAYGDQEAPQQVDTLRNEDGRSNDDFHHYVESPAELQDPDLDQAKQLDRSQTGGDPSAEDVGGADTDNPEDKIDDFLSWCDAQNEEANDQALNDYCQVYGCDDDDYQLLSDFLHEQDGTDPDTAGAVPPPAGGDPSQQGAPPPPPQGGMPPPPPPEEDPTQQVMGRRRRAAFDSAREDIGVTHNHRTPNTPREPGRVMGSDDGVPDYVPGWEVDKYRRSQRILTMFTDPQTGRRYTLAADEDKTDDEKKKPPWLEGDDDEDTDDDGDTEEDSDDGDDEDDDYEVGSESDDDLIDEAEADLEKARDQSKESRRRNAKSRTRTNKGRRARSPMSRSTLSERGRVVNARRNRHAAGEDGTNDDGDLSENCQGVQEEVYLSDTPGDEQVEAPGDDSSQISNTEDNLVATARRAQAVYWDSVNKYNQIQARRRYADEGDATENPVQVSIEYSGTDDPEIHLNTENQGFSPDLGADTEDTSPHDSSGGGVGERDFRDASVAAFRAFDKWLYDTTGRQARSHNANFTRRQATRWAKAARIPVEALWPALGYVLRQARTNEKGASMRRHAEGDEKLPVAAPDARIDVESPVANTTDDYAQGDQFDLDAFGENAGDGISDVDLSTDSQIWAPGEGDSGGEKQEKESRRADAVAAVRYARAAIKCGLIPESEEYNAMAQAQTMRHAVVTDRTALMEAILERTASRRVTAGSHRGTVQGNLPPGIGSGFTRSASTRRVADNDPSNDYNLYF